MGAAVKYATQAETQRFQWNVCIQVSENELLPLRYSTHKQNPHEEEFCRQAFTLPLDPFSFFSENCLIALIHSNRIGLHVFSGQTFHPTGATSLCTFHFLFLMAGPSGIGSGCSSSESSHEGDSKNLKLEATVSLNTLLCTEHPAVRSEANRDPKLPS